MDSESRPTRSTSWPNLVSLHKVCSQTTSLITTSLNFKLHQTINTGQGELEHCSNILCGGILKQRFGKVISSLLPPKFQSNLITQLDTPCSVCRPSSKYHPVKITTSKMMRGILCDCKQVIEVDGECAHQSCLRLWPYVKFCGRYLSLVTSSIFAIQLTFLS